MLVERASKLFGVELRRRRVEAGYSLNAFAKLVHYSKSHLSKIENGVKRPSSDLARLCDRALRCDGALAELVDDTAGGVPGPSHDDPSEVLVYDLDPDGTKRFLVASRRELFATGLLSAAGLSGLVDPSAAPSNSELPTLGIFRSWYEQTRALGQTTDARVLMTMLVSHAHVLSALADRWRGEDRRRAWALVADYLEYTGWMAQECGDQAGARFWTDKAVQYATAGGNDGMSAYAWVRYALMTMYQGNAEETVEAARQAQRFPCRPRIRGLAAQREAQGHALANRRSACLRALDRARELLAADPPQDRETVIGSANVVDHVQAATGWSLFELGDAAAAADLLGGTLDRIPPHATRAWARFAARRTLALAGCGRVQEADELAGRVLDAQAVVRSATIAADLRRLEVMMRRRHRDPRAARLSLRMHESLLVVAPAGKAGSQHG